MLCSHCRSWKPRGFILAFSYLRPHRQGQSDFIFVVQVLCRKAQTPKIFEVNVLDGPYIVQAQALININSIIYMHCPADPENPRVLISPCIDHECRSSDSSHDLTRRSPSPMPTTQVRKPTLYDHLALQLTRSVLSHRNFSKTTTQSCYLCHKNGTKKKPLKSCSSCKSAL